MNPGGMLHSHRQRLTWQQAKTTRTREAQQGATDATRLGQSCIWNHCAQMPEPWCKLRLADVEACLSLAMEADVSTHANLAEAAGLAGRRW